MQRPMCTNRGRRVLIIYIVYIYECPGMARSPSMQWFPYIYIALLLSIDIWKVWICSPRVLYTAHINIFRVKTNFFTAKINFFCDNRTTLLETLFDWFDHQLTSKSNKKVYTSIQTKNCIKVCITFMISLKSKNMKELWKSNDQLLCIKLNWGPFLILCMVKLTNFLTRNPSKFSTRVKKLRQKNISFACVKKKLVLFAGKDFFFFF